MYLVEAGYGVGAVLGHYERPFELLVPVPGLVLHLHLDQLRVPDVRVPGKVAVDQDDVNVSYLDIIDQENMYRRTSLTEKN